MFNTVVDHPVVIGITGASGAIYGIEALRLLHEIGVPTHLIISELGARTIAIETDLSLDDVRALADVHHSNKDLAASIASGSFPTRGMLIAPCSIKTLSGVANSFAMNLMVRSADVHLKERRPLVLMVRETPFHRGHLRLINDAAKAGAIVMPPVPAFYNRPRSVEEIVRHSVARAIDLMGIEHNLIERWMGDPRRPGVSC